MRLGLVVGCLVAAACANGRAVVPTVPLNEQFTLQRGENAVVVGTSVRLQFVDVIGDSRCPADVLCIQAGDATVRLRAFDDGAASDYDLHTGDSTRAAATHRQLRIELMRLEPYPFSSRPIDPNDYRATLKTTRP